MAKISGRWAEFIAQEKKKEYFGELVGYITEKRKAGNVWPSSNNVFKAFELTPFEKVKIVILGQDPYHTPNVAHGLAFSSLGEKLQPSLKVIFDELVRSFMGCPFPNSDYSGNGDLTSWASQGVLLLNRVLTVDEGKAGSHKNNGWELFTDNVINTIINEKEHVIWMLWGNDAQKALEGKKSLSGKQTILKACHPQAQNYPGDKIFVGCNHFYRTNKLLAKNNLSPINWDLNHEVPTFVTLQDYLDWRKLDKNNRIYPYFEGPEQEWTLFGKSDTKKRKDLVLHPIK